MIIVLESGCGEEDVLRVLGELEARGLRGAALHAGGVPVIHVTSGDTRPARGLAHLDQVAALIPTSGPRIRREGRRFYPYHFVRWSAAGIFLVGVLVTLAGWFPTGRGPDIDPYAEGVQVVFPWYLRPVQVLIELLPAGLAWLGWVAVWGLILVVFLLPVLDRTRGRSVTRRLPIVVVGLIVLGLVIALAVGGVR
jgi:hypothetical protein